MSAVDTPAFGVALDPFRPSEVLPPPGLAERPPYCPICQTDTFLYPTIRGQHDDLLFACLNCGYEAVWRIATNEWDPRPGDDASTWRQPYKMPPSQGRRQPVVDDTPPVARPAGPRDDDEDDDE